MTSSQSELCPEWCTKTHDASDFREKSFFHGRSFGLYEDGTPGVIEVGISQTDGVFHDREVLIDTVQMTSAQDLRDLAKDCLEAAAWMDENLGSELNLVNHGN